MRGIARKTTEEDREMRWCVKIEGDRNRDGGAWDEQGEAKEGRGKKKGVNNRISVKCES